MQPSVERRADPPVRMAFDAVVELRHADFAIPFQAGATNIGRHGIALEAPVLPEVGALLSCRFPLPGNDERVTVTGEVVWTAARERESGRFGLRFAELSERVAEALDHAFPPSPANDVGADDLSSPDDPEAAPGEELRLHLDGVASPIVARAVHRADDALVVEQPLPFLSLGRGVSVEGGRRAVLDSVDLVQGGDVPRLVLTLAWEDAVPVAADAETAALSLHDRDVAVYDDDPALDPLGLPGDTLRDLPPPEVGADRPALSTEPPRHRPRFPRAGDGTLAERPDGVAVAHRPPAVGPRRLVRRPSSAGMVAGLDTEADLVDAPPAAVAMGWLDALRDAGGLRELPARAGHALRGALPPVLRLGREAGRLGRKVGRTLGGALGLSRPSAAVETGVPAGPPRNARLPAASTGSAGAAGEGVRNPLRLVLVAAAAFAVAAAVFALLDGPGPEATAGVAAPGLGADPGTGAESPYAPAPGELATEEDGLDDPPEAAAPETVPADSPYAVDLDELTPDGEVPGAPETFGADHVPGGQSFLLRMSQPVRSLEGREEDDGFSVTMRGTLAKDRAGPIAAAHPLVERSMILNRGSYSVLTVRFVDGKRPPYQVVARNAALEVVIGR